MRRALMAAAAAVLVMVPAAKAEEPLGALADAVFSHMAATWLCRDALGGVSHYQAARVIAVDTLARYVGNTKATLLVDKMDQKFRNDPRTTNGSADPDKCVALVNDGLYRINVAKARLASGG